MDEKKLTNDEVILRCAELAHEANRIYCEARGDASQLPWAQAAEWQRTSAIEGVRLALGGASPEQQHAAWCESKVRDGWVFGLAKDATLRTHPCLVPYSDLPEVQRRKDGLYTSVVRAMWNALD